MSIDNCVICLGSLAEHPDDSSFWSRLLSSKPKLTSLACDHLFHKECLSRWIDRRPQTKDFRCLSCHTVVQIPVELLPALKAAKSVEWWVKCARSISRFVFLLVFPQIVGFLARRVLPSYAHLFPDYKKLSDFKSVPFAITNLMGGLFLYGTKRGALIRFTGKLPLCHTITEIYNRIYKTNVNIASQWFNSISGREESFKTAVPMAQVAAMVVILHELAVTSDEKKYVKEFEEAVGKRFKELFCAHLDDIKEKSPQLYSRLFEQTLILLDPTMNEDSKYFSECVGATLFDIATKIEIEQRTLLKFLLRIFFIDLSNYQSIGSGRTDQAREHLKHLEKESSEEIRILIDRCIVLTPDINVRLKALFTGNPFFQIEEIFESDKP